MNDTKRTNLGNPIDPSTDAQQQFGDPAGLTGITDTTASQQPPLSGNDLLEREKDAADGEDMFSTEEEAVLDKIAEARLLDLKSQGLILDQLDGAANDTINDAAPPSVLGEQSVSGDMPDPESDDDTLLNSHQVGLRMDEDYDDPKPLNIAADVAAAERSRRGG